MTATPSGQRFSLCNCGLSHEPRLNRRDLLIGGAATLAFGATVTSGVVPKAAVAELQKTVHRIDGAPSRISAAWASGCRTLRVIFIQVGGDHEDPSILICGLISMISFRTGTTSFRSGPRSKWVMPVSVCPAGRSLYEKT